MTTTSDLGPRATARTRRMAQTAQPATGVKHRREPPRGGLEVLSASMRAPRIPGKRCGTRLVALMCASSPDPYAHRLAGTAHPRPSSRLASRTAGLALASPTKSEPRPCSPPRGDTRRAAVAHLPMRSARRAPSPHVSAHRRRRRRPERQGGLPSPRTPGSASNGRLHGRSRDARKGRPPRARIDLAQTVALPWRSRLQRTTVQRTGCSSNAAVASAAARRLGNTSPKSKDRTSS